MELKGSDPVFEPLDPRAADELSAVLAELREHFPVYRTHSNRSPRAWLEEDGPPNFGYRPHPLQAGQPLVGWVHRGRGGGDQQRLPQTAPWPSLVQ
jgi:hypothetical protein